MILAFALGSIAGSILSIHIKPTMSFSVAWTILAVVSLIFTLVFPKKVMVLLAVASGILIIVARVSPNYVSQRILDSYVDQEIAFSGLVSKDPDYSDIVMTLALDHITFSDKELSQDTKIFVQVQPGEVKRTDRVTVKGVLNNGFGTYSGSVYRAKLTNIERQLPEDIFLKFRGIFSDNIKSHLPPLESGIALGYLLGQKTGVDKTYVETLSAVGLTHIIVASGAHLSILTGLMRKTFGRLSRLACLLSAFVVTIIFISITGLSASMLRAGLVSGLSLLLWYFGREIKPLRLIILIAAVTLIINPFYIIDLAWLLSFSSFTGILVLAPALTDFLFSKDKKPGFISATIITSLSAALLCSPILLFYFGQISLFSVFANLLILPTISIVMGLAALTGLFSSIIPPLSDFIGYICQLVVDYQISVANFFQKLDFSVLRIDKNNALVFLAYVPVIAIFFYNNFSKRKKQNNNKYNA